MVGNSLGVHSASHPSGAGSETPIHSGGAVSSSLTRLWGLPKGKAPVINISAALSLKAALGTLFGFSILGSSVRLGPSLL